MNEYQKSIDEFLIEFNLQLKDWIELLERGGENTKQIVIDKMKIILITLERD